METQADNQYQDRNLTCSDCGDSFLFEAGEQAYFIKNGLIIPKRCKKCRALRKLNSAPVPTWLRGEQK